MVPASLKSYATRLVWLQEVHVFTLLSTHRKSKEPSEWLVPYKGWFDLSPRGEKLPREWDRCQNELGPLIQIMLLRSEREHWFPHCQNWEQQRKGWKVLSQILGSTQVLFRLTLVMARWLPEQLKAFTRLLSMVQIICAITSFILGRTISSWPSESENSWDAHARRVLGHITEKIQGNNPTFLEFSKRVATEACHFIVPVVTSGADHSQSVIVRRTRDEVASTYTYTTEDHDNHNNSSQAMWVMFQQRHEHSLHWRPE